MGTITSFNDWIEQNTDRLQTIQQDTAAITAARKDLSEAKDGPVNIEDFRDWQSGHHQQLHGLSPAEQVQEYRVYVADNYVTTDPEELHIWYDQNRSQLNGLSTAGILQVYENAMAKGAEISNALQTLVTAQSKLSADQINFANFLIATSEAGAIPNETQSEQQQQQQIATLDEATLGPKGRQSIAKVVWDDYTDAISNARGLLQLDPEIQRLNYLVNGPDPSTWGSYWDMDQLQMDLQESNQQQSTITNDLSQVAILDKNLYPAMSSDLLFIDKDVNVAVENTNNTSSPTFNNAGENLIPYLEEIQQIASTVSMSLGQYLVAASV